MLQNINEYIEQRVVHFFGDKVTFKRHQEMLSIVTHPEHLIALINTLYNDREFKFKMLIDILAVDYPEQNQRFEVIYCLLSVEKNYRINVKISLNDNVSAPSLHTVYKNATWLEREVWDMHGIKFSGSKDERRLLTDYGFEGHPLRKDFPLTGYKEVYYDVINGKVAYRPVSLVQEYRDFDFVSPWEGTEKILPGDEKATPGIVSSDNGRK